MISKRCKYGIKALLALAKRPLGEPVLIGDLADQEKIPKKFLEVILLELKKKGILVSKKGKGGGYLLGSPPEAISLGRVIRALDGPLAPLPCASVTRHRKCDDCESEVTCGLRTVMVQVRDATAAVLDGTSLLDVVRYTLMQEELQKQVGNYVI